MDHDGQLTSWEKERGWGAHPAQGSEKGFRGADMETRMHRSSQGEAGGRENGMAGGREESAALKETPCVQNLEWGRRGGEGPDRGGPQKKN